MIVLRSILFHAAFWLWGAFMNILWLPSLALPWRATVKGQRLWAGGVCWMMPWLAGVRIEIRGRHRVPASPVLIAAKHQSLWDTLAWHVIADDPAIVMKRELLAIPIYGWYCRKTRMIPVDRDAGPRALKGLVRAALAAKAASRPIIIFPQGTRVAPGVAAPYLPGVAALYRQLELPCVPVALNSGLFWGRGAFLIRPGTLVLEFLDPIPPGLKRAEFMRELENRIESASTQLADEARAATDTDAATKAA